MTPKLNIVPAEIFAERVACNYSPNILAPRRHAGLRRGVDVQSIHDRAPQRSRLLGWPLMVSAASACACRRLGYCSAALPQRARPRSHPPVAPEVGATHIKSGT